MAQIEQKSQGWPYYRFATYYVDNRDNLRDIMKQLLEVSDDEVRIKEELFNLLSMFILTFEVRDEKIKRDLYKNKQKMIKIMEDFR